MKTLCIYVIYDSENIIDSYIGFFLSCLKSVMTHIVVVCNMDQIDKGEQNVTEYADEIFYRDNKGFDAGAIKDTLCEYVGWDKVNEYDELYLINDSFFGPFQDLNIMISKMRSKDLDFWGLIAHSESSNPKVGIFKEHIQTFWLTINNRLLHSEEFRNYWEKLPYYRKLGDVVMNHETVFTDYFSKKGFTYGTYADYKANEDGNHLYNYLQYIYIPKELIEKRSFPFVKKKVFCRNEYNVDDYCEAREALDYVDKNTDYDVTLIWENIIRKNSLEDIQRLLYLRYIIDDRSGNKSSNLDKALVIVCAANISACEIALEYIKKLNVKTVVVPKNPSIARIYETQGVSIFSDFEIEKNKYKYICIIRDTDISPKNDFTYKGKNYFDTIWGNLICNDSFIEKSLEVFDDNNYLGALFPPEPIWSKKDQQDYEQKIHPGVWIKRDLFDLKRINNGYILEDIDIKRKGYCRGTVENIRYCAKQTEKMDYYLSDIAKQICQQYGGITEFEQVKIRMSVGAILKFCSKHSRNYIYGTGLMAEKYVQEIGIIDGFVVSDGHKKQDGAYGHKVFSISEIEPDGAGIVVCTTDKYQREIVPLLKEKGFDYFTIMTSIK